MNDRNLQQGKAAEHLVCCDLIMQGYNVFLADQGCEFDIVIDANGRLYKVQVKSTFKMKIYDRAKYVYRFGTRRGKGGKQRTRTIDCDFYAFVALDIRKVSYFKASEMGGKGGNAKQTIDMRTREREYPKRTYSNGTKACTFRGKYIEDHGELHV